MASGMKTHIVLNSRKIMKIIIIIKRFLECSISFWGSNSKPFTIALDYSEQLHNNSNKNNKACEGTRQKYCKQ